jgi:ubiquinone/menaquinone biosynthesis C-methylase UbiE
MSYWASGFANVDATNQVESFAQCLQLLGSLDFFQRYKQKTFDELHLFDGAQVLEVGCGTGEDALTLGSRVGSSGRVVAVDRSQALLDRAIAQAQNYRLPVDFVQADAQQLPLDDNRFDAARIDRTLQHIAKPERAISELVRVVRSQGYVVAMEPDWETFTIDSDNRTVTRKLLNFWCDSFPSGWIGRNLSKYFHQAGLVNLVVSPESLVIDKLDLANKVFDIIQTTHRAEQAGSVTAQDVHDWLSELQHLDQAQQFFCSFTGFIVTGRKP